MLLVTGLAKIERFSFYYFVLITSVQDYSDLYELDGGDDWDWRPLETSSAVTTTDSAVDLRDLDYGMEGGAGVSAYGGAGGGEGLSGLETGLLVGLGCGAVLGVLSLLR